MKTKFLLPLLALPYLFTSCEHCYDCVDYNYCLDCELEYDAFPGTTFGVEDCFNTESERDIAMQEIIDDGQSGGYSATCTKDKVALPGLDVEVCDKKKDAEGKANTLETTGYECTER